MANELLSLALTQMHEQQLINGRDREALIRLREEQRRSQEPSSIESDQPTPNLFQTAQEIAEMTPENTAWVVKGFAAEHSITELTGHAKEAGKTSFLMGMVHSVLTGGSFLDQPTSQGTVVYLTEEKKPTFIAALQRADLMTPDIAADLHVMTYWNAAQLGWEEICNQAERQCDVTSAKLLIVDTLSQFAGFSGEQENNSGDANASLLRLQQIAHNHPLAVIVVRHDRKSGGRVGLAGRGSGAFTAGVDVVLQLSRLDKGNWPTHRKLTAIGRYEETPKTGLVINRIASFTSREGEKKESFRWEVVGDSSAITRQHASAEFLELLPTGEAEALSIEQIVERSGQKSGTANNALKQLESQGSVAKVGKGKRNDPYRYFQSGTE